MNGYLLDTNVPSELTRTPVHHRVEQWLKNVNEETLHLSAISLGEIRKGTAILAQGAKRRELERWVEEILRPWFSGRILPVDDIIAERWGVLSAEQKLKGRPLSMADGLIAATALEHGLTVVTRNVKDFTGLGVALLNPWES